MNLITFYLKLFILFCSSISFAGNNPPQALRNLPAQELFQFLYHQLDSVYEVCLHDLSCSLSEKEKSLLSSIQLTLGLEQKMTLQFKSGKKNPGLFQLDGNVRIAVTGNNVGDPIYINLDLTSEKDARGRLQTIYIEQIIAILTHELGHHHNWISHNELDYLGLKVARYFLSQLQWMDIAGNNNQDPDLRPLKLYLSWFNFPFTETSSKRAETRVWIFDEYRVTDLTENILKENLCHGKTQLEIPIHVRFFNWEAVSWGFAGEKDIYKCPRFSNTGYVGGSFFVLTSNIQMQCKEFISQAQMNLNVHFRRSCDGELVLDPYNQALFLFQKLSSLKITR